MLNGVEVLSEPGTYVYTVKGDVTIHMEDEYSMGEYGWITITEQGWLYDLKRNETESIGTYRRGKSQ